MQFLDISIQDEPITSRQIILTKRLEKEGTVTQEIILIFTVSDMEVAKYDDSIFIMNREGGNISK